MSTETDGEWSVREQFWTGLHDFMFDEDRIHRGQREAAQIAALLSLSTPARIVDLCCGPGRHAVPLARLGHRVTGVDSTGSYLDSARARALAEGVTAEFVQADAREYRADPAADVVLNLWSSFGYFTEQADNVRLLGQAYSSLREGGAFLLHVRSRETFPARTNDGRVWLERDGMLFLEERAVVDDWRRIRGRWIVVSDGRRQDYPYTSWLYSGQEITDMLRSVGFSHVSLHGDFSGAPYDQHAKHLVAVARR
ncbi:class I SAM-dependent methyltransferase [Streptomyces sp. NPDC032940]|uniref:class I SAM-dependent methyltransferase n=1 Tax=Streptomyces sp. NPDC032940 TaxID=3155366 RepID=UPI0033F0BBF4